MGKDSFNNQLYEGNKGKVMLQLTKSYKGDSRFKLDQRFKDDIDASKLPQKFREIAQKGVIEKIEKTKKITKDKPLIIQRFQPGTASAQAIVKKAENKKKYLQGLKRHEEKMKKKNIIQKGVDRLKKAQLLLSKANKQEQRIESQHNRPKFKISVNGNRKQAFKQAEFKLFG